MASAEQIQSSLLLGWAYYNELLEEYYEEQKNGCIDCGDSAQLSAIRRYGLILEDAIADNKLNELTDEVYACYLKLIMKYSGMSLDIDPTAQIPSIVIIEEGGVVDPKPDPINIYFDMMSGDDGNGGKTTYTNPLWIGFYPYMQTTGVVQLFEVLDYSYNVNTGSFTLLPNAPSGVSAIYEGGSIRVYNYSKVSDTPPIERFTYKLVNNSSIDASYSFASSSTIIPLEVGETVESPVVIGDSISAEVLDGQQLVYTVYDADGEEIFTTSQVGEGVVNGLPMVENENQNFIYTDTQPNLPNPPTNGIVDNINKTFTFTGGEI